MKIRQARFSDLDRILEIELENFSLEEAIPRSVFEAHLREIQTSFLVAEKEGRILGYIEGPVVPHRHLHDQSFTEEVEDHSHRSGGYISVTSLSERGKITEIKAVTPYSFDIIAGDKTIVWGAAENNGEKARAFSVALQRSESTIDITGAPTISVQE